MAVWLTLALGMLPEFTWRAYFQTGFVGSASVLDVGRSLSQNPSDIAEVYPTEVLTTDALYEALGHTSDLGAAYVC